MNSLYRFQFRYFSGLQIIFLLSVLLNVSCQRCIVSESRRDIVDAIVSGDIGKLEHMIDMQIVSANETIDVGGDSTPIIFLALQSDPGLVSMLVRRGANPNLFYRSVRPIDSIVASRKLFLHQVKGSNLYTTDSPIAKALNGILPEFESIEEQIRHFSFILLNRFMVPISETDMKELLVAAEYGKYKVIATDKLCSAIPDDMRYEITFQESGIDRWSYSLICYFNQHAQMKQIGEMIPIDGFWVPVSEGSIHL